MMKRRQYLKSMTILTTGFLSRNMLPVFFPEQKPMHVIAIGSISFNCFYYLWEQQVKGQYVLISDQFTHDNSIDDHDDFVYIDISEFVTTTNNDSINCTLCHNDVKSMLEIGCPITLITHFSSKEEYVLCVELYEQVRTQICDLNVVHFNPFNFEGKTKRNWSNQFEQMLSKNDLIINVESYRRMCADLSLIEFFNIMFNAVHKHVAN